MVLSSRIVQAGLVIQCGSVGLPLDPPPTNPVAVPRSSMAVGAKREQPDPPLRNGPGTPGVAGECRSLPQGVPQRLTVGCPTAGTALPVAAKSTVMERAPPGRLEALNPLAVVLCWPPPPAGVGGIMKVPQGLLTPHCLWLTRQKVSPLELVHDPPLKTHAVANPGPGPGGGPRIPMAQRPWAWAGTKLAATRPTRNASACGRRRSPHDLAARYEPLD